MGLISSMSFEEAISEFPDHVDGYIGLIFLDLDIVEENRWSETDEEASEIHDLILDSLDNYAVELYKSGYRHKIIVDNQ